MNDEWEDRGDDHEPGWFERSESHESVTETVYPVEGAPVYWMPLPALPDDPPQNAETITVPK